jgi:hypothetical protein
MKYANKRATRRETQSNREAGMSESAFTRDGRIGAEGEDIGS